uniref:Uncharacterized protein n=1 Tax=Populus trichocarpa TaxID=3694 RepID=A0A3N7FJ90_POPTR
MSSMKDFAMDHQTQQQQPYSGAGNGHDGSYNRVAEVGWFILGEDQQQVGPYTFSELSVPSVINSKVSGQSFHL